MNRNPMMRRGLATGLLLALAAAPGQGFAHHSFAMYDQQKIVALTGTVKAFQWTNPHALLWVEGGLEPGRADDLWSIELSTGPGNLARLGWSKRSLKPGDKVVVDLNPLRNGAHAGSLKKVMVVATGEVLTTTAAAAPR